LGGSSNAYLLENRVCRGYFNLHNLFVKPDHYEELKPTVAVFIYLQPFFATVLQLAWKDDLSVVKSFRQF
jgi:hypothetical protein